MQHTTPHPLALRDGALHPLRADAAHTPSARAAAERAMTAPWMTVFEGAALSSAEVLTLQGLARLRTVAAQGTVFDRRDRAHALLLLQQGEVALGYRGADGVFHIERPVRGPAWLDQSSAWLGETHAMDARASTDVVVVELPVDAVRQQLERQPGLGRHLVHSLAREVHNLSANTHELMHKDAPARFAAWLLQRVPAGSQGSLLLQLGERKRDIASQLAITPETLSRLMRSLTRQGLISVSGYTVQLLDLAALRAVAAG